MFHGTLPLAPPGPVHGSPPSRGRAHAIGQSTSGSTTNPIRIAPRSTQGLPFCALSSSEPVVSAGSRVRRAMELPVAPTSRRSSPQRTRATTRRSPKERVSQSSSFRGARRRKRTAHRDHQLRLPSSAEFQAVALPSHPTFQASSVIRTASRPSETSNSHQATSCAFPRRGTSFPTSQWVLTTEPTPSLTRSTRRNSGTGRSTVNSQATFPTKSQALFPLTSETCDAIAGSETPIESTMEQSAVRAATLLCSGLSRCTSRSPSSTSHLKLRIRGKSVRMSASLDDN